MNPPSNKSLDRSVGYAFGIIIGPAKLERFRAAASTQSLCAIQYSLKLRPTQLFSLVLFTLTLFSTTSCKQFSPNQNDAKFKEVEKLYASLPIHPTFKEIGGSSSSKAMLASIGKYYKSDARYEDIKTFYSTKLMPEGWRLTKERNLKDWSTDLGGRQLIFGKGQYSVVIEYRGDKASDPDWNYGIDVEWHDGGSSDR